MNRPGLTTVVLCRFTDNYCQVLSAYLLSLCDEKLQVKKDPLKKRVFSRWAILIGIKRPPPLLRSFADPRRRADRFACSPSSIYPVTIQFHGSCAFSDCRWSSPSVAVGWYSLLQQMVNNFHVNNVHDPERKHIQKNVSAPLWCKYQARYGGQVIYLCITVR